MNERESYLRKLRNPAIDSVVRTSIFKKVVDLCKRSFICSYCNYANGQVPSRSFFMFYKCCRTSRLLYYGHYTIILFCTIQLNAIQISTVYQSDRNFAQVKKVGGGCLKIVHEKNIKRDDDLMREESIMKQIHKRNQDLKQYQTHKKFLEVLNPIRAYDIMVKITEEDAALLWMNTKYGKADSLIMWAVPVTPVPIRPSVPVEVGGGGTTEDDLTMKLQEIVVVNTALKMCLEKGATMKMVSEDWEFLQVQVAQFINGETQGVPRALMAPKPIRGLCQRLKG